MATKTSTTPTKSTSWIPTGYQTVTPFITCADAKKEIAFLKSALGAEERMSMNCPESGRVMHAEIKIGSSIMMISDTSPDTGCDSKSIKDLGGSPAGFYLYVQDVDAAFAKATKAGAKPGMPPTDMFWGDRMCSVTCPEGFNWSLATHVNDPTPTEMEEGRKAFMEQMKAGGGKH